MSFQNNAFQSNSFQEIITNILNYVKLIMGLPNKPFKKGEVIMEMKRAKIKMILKNTDPDNPI